MTNFRYVVGVITMAALAGACGESLYVEAPNDPDTFTPTPDPGSEPETTPDPDSSPPGDPVEGIWISPEEVAVLPTSGSAWQALLSKAGGSTGTPDLSNQDDNTNVKVLANALVYARTGENANLDKVKSALETITYDNTETGGRTLALARELAAYVISADLINLKEVDPALDEAFKLKLRDLLTMTLNGRTLASTHEDRPNNWGTHAGASRVAVAVYLQDAAELQRAADVFKGYLGDRATYSDFKYGDLSWQADSGAPVGINPAGATKSGHSIDGVIPDDQRRCGSFGFPPCRTGYVWEALQGSLVQAALLYRQGYDVWDWEDQALLRALTWLHNTTFSDGKNFEAEGDDSWLPWIANYYYCEDFPADTPSRHGKNLGFTDWTHEANPNCQ